jgi:hypothetical protein
MTPAACRNVCLAALAALCSASPAMAAAPAPAPVFHSILPKLATSAIPVYLPSWLPNFGFRVYPFVFFSHHRHTYEVDLSADPHAVGTATEMFYLTANMDALSPGPHARIVSLGHRITGYVGSISGTAGDSLTIRWRAGGIVYVIGRLGQEKWLIHAARSVVCVASGPERRHNSIDLSPNDLDNLGEL